MGSQKKEKKVAQIRHISGKKSPCSQIFLEINKFQDLGFFSQIWLKYFLDDQLRHTKSLKAKKKNTEEYLYIFSQPLHCGSAIVGWSICVF